MSPLGITSRMTMGKIIELLLGKAAAISGDVLDGLDDQDFETPIEERTITISKILNQAGFSSSGKEMFMDGITGKMIDIPVMCGVVSYAKLNHMVSRKAHARATGPVHMLTRQPNEGRRQGGGLRFGPMEAECVIAHSAAEILRERTLTAADPFTCYVCSECGFVADGNSEIEFYFCRLCRTGKMVRQVEIGFTSKLMAQELMATGIKVQMGLSDQE
jgi:DNA-directed RNA polymerase beta subunit